MKTLGRSNFTDTLRAEIFVRDRATCCFSGANLWLLDAPLRLGYQRDWVDHVKPSFRGGAATLANGVCASHEYNMKKRHNGAGNLYLFRDGMPTEDYYSMFGPLPAFVEKRLVRLAELKVEDWYLNRAIGLCFLAFLCQFRSDRGEKKPVRGYREWLNAAFKQLQQYQRRRRESSIEERRICLTPTDDQANWLRLREVRSLDDLSEKIQPLLKTFVLNSSHWAGYFWDSATQSERSRALEKAVSCVALSQEVVQCLKNDFAARQGLAKKSG